MLIKLAALGALGYVGYRYYDSKVRQPQASPAGGGKRDTWDLVDEQGDESFPASDPPGNY